jgi:hypothetical protein
MSNIEARAWPDSDTPANSPTVTVDGTRNPFDPSVITTFTVGGGPGRIDDVDESNPSSKPVSQHGACAIPAAPEELAMGVEFHQIKEKCPFKAAPRAEKRPGPPGVPALPLMGVPETAGPWCVDPSAGHLSPTRHS